MESGWIFLSRPGVLIAYRRAPIANLSKASSYLDVAQLSQWLDEGLFSTSRQPFEH
jgi:hypothetical protein